MNAEAPPAKPTSPASDEPCFPSNMATRIAVENELESWITIDKIFLMESRIGFIHGDEVTTLPLTGGNGRAYIAEDFLVDATVSGNRLYVLTEGGGIAWLTPMLDLGAVVTTGFSPFPGSLHVDDQWIYRTLPLGYASGLVERTARNVGPGLFGTELDTIAEGPIARYMAGTKDTLFITGYGDEGNGSWGEVARVAKAGGPVTGVVSWTNAKPSALVADDQGIVLGVQGDYGGNDSVVTFGFDGTAVNVLAAAPAKTFSSVAADASEVFYVREGHALERVARSGGQPAIVATTPACRITAVNVEEKMLHVATATDGKTTREVWRLSR